MATTALGRPPGPRNPPILGQYSAFRRNPPGFLLRTAREFGDVSFFRIGPQNVYQLANPAAIRDVLVTHQHSFIKSRVLQRAKILLGEGLLTSEAPLHTRQRRLVQPAFHRERLAAYAETMVEYGVRTRDRWEDGQTLDVAQEMMRLTLAIVARTLFSADVESDAPPLEKHSQTCYTCSISS
jgi:cytochrome P450